MVRLAVPRPNDRFCDPMCGAGTILAERARDYGDVTEYLSIPVFYVGWFIAASTAITAVAMITTGLLHIFAPHTLSEHPQ